MGFTTTANMFGTTPAGMGMPTAMPGMPMFLQASSGFAPLAFFQGRSRQLRTVARRAQQQTEEGCAVACAAQCAAAAPAIPAFAQMPAMPQLQMMPIAPNYAAYTMAGNGGYAIP